MSLDNSWNVINWVQRIAVERRGVEASSTSSSSTGATNKLVTNRLENGSAVNLERVLGLFEVAVLNAHVGLAAGVVSVGSAVVKVVVVEVGVLQVVTRWATGAEVEEVVVVGGHGGQDVFSPADTEGFVVVSENVVGDGDEIGVETAVNEAVLTALEEA